MAHNHGNEYQTRIVRENGIEELSTISDKGISLQLRTDFARGLHSSGEGAGSLYLNHQSITLTAISISDPLILGKTNLLRLELSVQKGSAICSKRNTSVTARLDSGQIQARAPESLSQIA